jgi:hypothetical protein
MASTFSSLKFELIGTGEQDGTWGDTTNTNLGTAIEQAITGSGGVTFTSADVTLTLANSNTSQTARNLRLVLVGTSDGARQLIVPAIEKQYIVKNELADTVTIKNSSGNGVAIPSGRTTVVFNDGTNVVDATTYLSSLTVGGTTTISGNVSVTGTTTLTGALTGNTASFSGLVTAATPANGANNTSVATTAFVQNAVGTLGTMASQNSNSVSITGGSISGITDLAVADGGTGASTFALNNVLLGNGTASFQTVAPGTSGFALRSNGTTWTSSRLGLGISGEVWNDLTGSRSFNTSYTNSRDYPIAVSARTGCSGASQIAFIVNGLNILQFNWQWNGCGSFGGGFVIVPPGATYQLNSGQGLDFWRELY